MAKNLQQHLYRDAKPSEEVVSGVKVLLRRFENVIAMKTGANRVVGFHSYNLQVASLDETAWQAFENDTQQCENKEQYSKAAPHSEASAREAREAREEIESWSREVDSRATDSAAPLKIKSLTINIAQVCNLKCTYCAAGGDGTYGSQTAQIEVSRAVRQVDMFLERLSAGEDFHINFLGGEPLIYPNALKAIADHAREQGLKRKINVGFEITTNATLVTPIVATLLAELGCHVNVSLDGPASINDVSRKTRGGKPSTSATLRGIQELINIKAFLSSLNVNAVFGKHGISVLDSYIYLREMPWDRISLTYALDKDDAIYSPVYTEQMLQVADHAFQHGGEKELRRIANFDSLFKGLDQQLRVLNHCGAGKSHLQVDTEGRFYACNWFVNDARHEVGRDLTLNAGAIAKFEKSLIELNDCNSCWAKFLCGGGCMYVNQVKNGTLHKRNAEFCDRTRAILAKGIELYEKARN